MITERISFRAGYGKGDDLVALFKEQANGLFAAPEVLGARLYTDFTGPMFSVIVETDFADLDAYTAFTRRDMAEYGTSEFQQWFARMMAVTDGGERQLLNAEKLR
jgi:hypothetical protein